MFTELEEKGREEEEESIFREGTQRIELRCVAETGPERSILLAGGKMSVA